jgi:hypothetical protein
MNLNYMMEKHLAIVNKSSEMKNQVFKLIENYSLLKDNNFIPEEVYNMSS